MESPGETDKNKVYPEFDRCIRLASEKLEAEIAKKCINPQNPGRAGSPGRGESRACHG